MQNFLFVQLTENMSFNDGKVQEKKNEKRKRKREILFFSEEKRLKLKLPLCVFGKSFDPNQIQKVRCRSKRRIEKCGKTFTPKKINKIKRSTVSK